MSGVWNQARIGKLIKDGVEESLSFDYKAADSLGKQNNKKAEITKDVSAMANSAGGTIIYGVREYQDKTRQHLPEMIDPVDRTAFSKEWLEQIISSIQPRLEGVIIHPVVLDTSATDVVYVVEIPQSRTAHQARDCRYYKRFNFESTPMLDYEIRDVMGRRQYPRIELEFDTELSQKVVHTGGGFPGFSGYVASQILGEESAPSESSLITELKLNIWGHNTGTVYANYVNIILHIPDILMPTEDEELLLMQGGKRQTSEKNGILYYQHFDDNTRRDIIGFDNTGLSMTPNYGPARHVPILPERYFGFEEVELGADLDAFLDDGLFIKWEVFADNASALKSRTPISEIDVKSILD